MKNFTLCKELFVQAMKDLKYSKYSNKNRILDEEDYFEAYLYFINNSINYSRFTYTIKDVTIKGKYLNEKVNRWTNAGLFKYMYTCQANKYIKTKTQSKIENYHIDGHIVTNKNGVDKIGRCTYYKSKNAYNLQTIVDGNGVNNSLQTIVDGNGVTVGISLNSANKSESELLKETFENSLLVDKNNEKIIIKNKNKKHFTADAGYDSKKNRDYLVSKGFIPLIWSNLRNTKDAEIIKSKKLNRRQINQYKKRHIIENSYSWMETKVPRLAKIFDKKSKNYLSMVYIAIIDVIAGKVKKHPLN